MGQEFVIKSPTLEDKINQLLPSQGGQQPGVDLSASTTIIPIVDLTESAEGSNLRQDLQTALSHGNTTTYSISNTTTTIANTTGYWRIFGIAQITGGVEGAFFLGDGTTNKQIGRFSGNSNGCPNVLYDFVVFLAAGESIFITCSSNMTLSGCVRQLADISGNLIDPI